MSDSHPMQASTLKVGGYVIIKQTPCKIIGMTTSKPGKYGHYMATCKESLPTFRKVEGSQLPAKIKFTSPPIEFSM